MAIKRHCEKRHGVERFVCLALVWSQEITLFAFFFFLINICFDFLRIDFICYQYKGKCERKLFLICLRQWKYRKGDILCAGGHKN